MAEFACERCGESVKAGTRCDVCGLMMSSKQLKAARSVDDDHIPGPTKMTEPKSLPVDVAEEIKPPAARKAKAAKKKVGHCLRCGKKKTIISRGICQSCRYHETKAGTLDDNFPVLKGERNVPPPDREAMRVEPIEPEDVCVQAGRAPVVEAPEPSAGESSLSLPLAPRDADLLSKLQRLADHERRTIQGQILHILDKEIDIYMEGVA